MRNYLTLAEAEEIRRANMLCVEAKLLRIHTSLRYLKLIYGNLDETGALGKANERALEVFKQQFPSLQSVAELNKKLDAICDNLEPEGSYTRDADYLKLAAKTLDTGLGDEELSQSHSSSILSNQAAYLGITPRETISYINALEYLKYFKNALCILGGLGTLTIFCYLLDKVPKSGAETNLSFIAPIIGRHLGVIGEGVGNVLDFVGALAVTLTVLFLPFWLWALLAERISQKISKILLQRIKSRGGSIG